MDRVVEVSYDLFSSSDAFINAWNADPACSAVAIASQAPREKEQYGVDLVQGFLVVLSSVTLGVASNALYDAVTGRLTLKGPKRVTHRTVRLPDGTEIEEIVEEH